MNLSERLKLLRKEKGLKQVDVADVLDISRSSYGHYETGHALPNKEALEKLSDYYDVSVDFLLGKSDVRKFEFPETETIAAHHSGEWTKEELEEIEVFKEFIRLRRSKKNK